MKGPHPRHQPQGAPHPRLLTSHAALWHRLSEAAPEIHARSPQAPRSGPGWASLGWRSGHQDQGLPGDMEQGRNPSGPLCDSLREVWGLQVASGLRPAEITWDPGTRWVAEEGRWREARPPRPWGNQAEVFSPRNSEDVGHEQPVRGQVWDWGVGGGPGALPAPPLPRSRGASQQHGRASRTTGAPLVEILPGDPGQVGQPGDREVGSRVALGPIPPRLSLPPLVTSCLRSHPTPPASPPPSPKWTGLSSSPERPWVKPGEGVRPSSVGEALGPQGLLGPVSPGPLSAQTVPWSSL